MSTIGGMCCGLVLSALLALSNVVINEVAHMRPVVLAHDEFQGMGDSVVPSHRGVMMSSGDSQLHGFRDVDSVLMVKNAIFQFS